jgi:hypothetical protein
MASKLSLFLAELKRRKVYRSAVPVTLLSSYPGALVHGR